MQLKSNLDPSLYVSQDVISPAVWQSECDCLIGPFSAKSVAEAFKKHATFDKNRISLSHTFVKGNAWFISVKAPSVTI